MTSEERRAGGERRSGAVGAQRKYVCVFCCAPPKAALHRKDDEDKGPNHNGHASRHKAAHSVDKHRRIVDGTGSKFKGPIEEPGVQSEAHERHADSKYQAKVATVKVILALRLANVKRFWTDARGSSSAELQRDTETKTGPFFAKKIRITQRLPDSI